MGQSFVVQIDLDAFFATAEGHRIWFDTIEGSFTVDLYQNEEVRETVENFQVYVDAGAFDETFFHRNIPGVLQGGGYRRNPQGSQYLFDPVQPLADPIPLQYHHANRRGTIAMARTSNPNSATSGWFFNTVDNSSAYAPGGVSPEGYAAFGEITDEHGLAVLDRLHAIPIYNAGQGFETIPFVGPVLSEGVNRDSFVMVHSVRRFPDYTLLSVTGTDGHGATIVHAELSGRSLRLYFHPGLSGSGEITIRATDSSGGSIEAAIPYRQVPSEIGYVSGSYPWEPALSVYWSNWFGYYWAGHWPYLYSYEIGWIYAFAMKPESYWAYHYTGHGWLYFQPESYPHAYRAGGGSPGWINLRE